MHKVRDSLLGHRDSVSIAFEDLEDYQDDEDDDHPGGPSFRGGADELGSPDVNAEDLEMEDFIVDEVAERRRSQQRRRPRDRAVSAAYQEALQVHCVRLDNSHCTAS